MQGSGSSRRCSSRSSSSARNASWLAAVTAQAGRLEEGLGQVREAAEAAGRARAAGQQQLRGELARAEARVAALEEGLAAGAEKLD